MPVELKCRIYDTDRIRVSPDNDDRLSFECIGDDGVMVDVYADASSSRAFARGVLAMADRLDGGEVDVRPRVGDRVRVLQGDPDALWKARYVGMVGTVQAIREGSNAPYHVRVGPGGYGGVDGDGYCARVELVDESPADIDAATVTDERAVRLATLETARRIAGVTAPVDHVLRLVAYLEGN